MRKHIRSHKTTNIEDLSKDLRLNWSSCREKAFVIHNKPCDFFIFNNFANISCLYI